MKIGTRLPRPPPSADAAGDRRGTPSLPVMAAEYRCLLTDRTRLLLLQGFAACDDPEVRETVRAAFGTDCETIVSISGLDPARLKVFVALGMLLMDVAAMDAAELDDAWARAALEQVPVEFFG